MWIRGPVGAKGMRKLKSIFSAQKVADDPVAAAISVSDLVATMAEPAAVLDRDGLPQFANDPGRHLLAKIADERAATQDLALLIGRSRLLKSASTGRLKLKGLPQVLVDQGASQETDSHSGPQSFDIQIVPVSADSEQSLFFAKEITAEINLATALSASRELYRDLVSCSSDFAWETDAHGSFIFVSKRGALGYSPQELNGRPADEMLCPAPGDSETHCSQSPFTTDEPVQDKEVWLEGKQGQKFCMCITSIPVHDKTGRKRGVRGAGQDVTELRLKETKLAASRKRNDAISQIVDAMNGALDPADTLAAAAQSILNSTQAYRCYIYRTQAGRFVTADGYCTEAAFGHGQLRGRSVLAGPEIENLATHLQRAAKNGDRLVSILIGEWQFLADFTYHGGTINGAIVISRPANQKPFRSDVMTILSAISEQAGIGIAQVNQTEELQTLSRNDTLTRLLNRRAFLEQAEVSRYHHIRHKRRSALLYIDVKNFKQINETRGHEQGDSVLMAIARLLKTNVRQSDLVVRLGGDEFGILLAETAASGAKAKAEDLLSGIHQSDDRALRETEAELCIGIAEFDPETYESVIELLERADRARQEAKTNPLKSVCISRSYEVEHENEEHEVA